MINLKVGHENRVCRTAYSSALGIGLLVIGIIVGAGASLALTRGSVQTTTLTATVASVTTTTTITATLPASTATLPTVTTTVIATSVTTVNGNVFTGNPSSFTLKVNCEGCSVAPWPSPNHEYWVLYDNSTNDVSKQYPYQYFNGTSSILIQREGDPFWAFQWQVASSGTAQGTLSVVGTFNDGQVVQNKSATIIGINSVSISGSVSCDPQCTSS